MLVFHDGDFRGGLYELNFPVGKKKKPWDDP